MEYWEEIEALRDEAENNPESPAVLDLLGKAVRIAESNGDWALSADIREDLVYYGPMLGRPELALVHFPWILTKFREDPTILPIQHIRFAFTALFTVLPDYPTISLSSILDLKEEYCQLVSSTGLKSTIMYQTLRNLSLQIGDMENATVYHEKYLLGPQITEEDIENRDANEPSYDHGWNFLYYHYLGDFEKARKALDLAVEFEGNTLTDELSNLGNICLLAALSGNWQPGLQILPRMIKLLKIHSGIRFFSAVTEATLLLTATQNFEKALRLFEIYLPLVLEERPAMEIADIQTSWTLMFRQIKIAGRDNLALSLPNEFEGFSAEGKYATSDLEAYFNRVSGGIIDKFDERNQNKFFAAYREGWMNILVADVQIPLPKH